MTISTQTYLQRTKSLSTSGQVQTPVSRQLLHLQSTLWGHRQPFQLVGGKTWSCAQACLSSIYMYEQASLHTSAAPHMQLSAAVIDQQRSFSETSHPSWQPSTMLFLSLLYTHLTSMPALSSQVRMRLSPGLAVSVIALNEHGKPWAKSGAGLAKLGKHEVKSVTALVAHVHTRV